jgi:hypothetical protein
MLPLIIGGLGLLIVKALFDDDEQYGKIQKKKIFVSFAIEDSKY